MKDGFSVLNYMEILINNNYTSPSSCWEVNSSTLDVLEFEMAKIQATFKPNRSDRMFAFGLEIVVDDRVPHMMVKLNIDRIKGF